jgi:hypothetical protein
MIMRMKVIDDCQTPLRRSSAASARDLPTTEHAKVDADLLASPQR